jgi:hypothetical protein
MMVGLVQALETKFRGNKQNMRRRFQELVAKECRESSQQQKLVTRDKLEYWRTKFARMPIHHRSKPLSDGFAQDFLDRYSTQTDMLCRGVATILAIRGQTSVGETGL